MTKDEDFESPKIQTWVLKVSIHDCEKCYKKVERVLHSIDGVHDFTVDAGKQMVTVTGNVHSKILLKELRKSFKNADLWPVFETPKQQEGGKSGKDGGGDANEHAVVAQNKTTETPSYCCEQTWTLKVHSNCYCEGCKQKISKVLQSIDGVRSSTIDAAEQKVTVTGNVASADVLLKKLLKSGKPAELWEVAQNKQQNEAKTQEHQKEKKLGKDGGSYANEDAAVAESKMQNQNPKSTKQQKEQNLGRHEDNGQQLEEDALFNDQPKMFEMKTLSLSTKLGEGGFGTVYKGTTHDGKQVAVKKLSLNSDQRNSDQRRKEFLNEVKLLAKVKHRNLVKLLGCCVDGLERWIVYEYLPNKSLHEFLSDADKRKELDWQKRHGIIRGSASGLLYLHQGSQPRIVHRDIKPSNILLDDKLNPKIGDFGIAKLFPEDVTRLNTVPAGSFGYMAPECIMSGELSVKADVYSFGVVLLELTTGRKMGDRTPSSEMVLRWVWRKYREGNTEEIIDPAIIEACDVGKASRCIHVGLLCTQMDSSLRPSMSEVNSMLSTDSITLTEPTKPPF